MSVAATRGTRLPGPVRRKLIIEAARKVFLRNGLGGSRTRQIAEEAGINEGLLYRYFDSKEAIFEAAVVEPLEEMLTDVFEIGHRLAALDGYEREEQIRQAILHMVQTMGEIVPLVGIVLFSDQESGQAFYRDKLFPMLERTFEAAKHGTVGWSMRPIDPSVVMTSVFGMVFGVCMDRIFRRTEISDDHLAEEMTALVVHGLSIPEGRKKPPAKRNTAKANARAAARRRS